MKAFIALFALVAGCSAISQQEQKLFDALRILRGGRDLTVEDQISLIANAVAGRDYPINAYIPAPQYQCSFYKQPGFYAEVSAPSNCQAFYRCDDNGILWPFICPNGTLFNQITLVCDWFFNVDCKASAQFYDYSNSRLADQTAVLLDNHDDYIYQTTGAVAVPVSVAKPAARPAAILVVKAPGRRN